MNDSITNAFLFDKYRDPSSNEPHLQHTVKKKTSTLAEEAWQLV